jgi:hypothetical protein
MGYGDYAGRAGAIGSADGWMGHRKGIVRPEGWKREMAWVTLLTAVGWKDPACAARH